VNKARIPTTDYSKIAKYYDIVRPAPDKVWLSRVIEYGEIASSCVVLDVGCGTGRFALNMLTVKPSVFVGLEPSTEMLKQAIMKDRLRRILWIRGDGQQLSLQSNLFHCVYMTLVIHHMKAKEMALRQIYRVLKKDGRCVIMTNSHSCIKKHVLSYFPGVLAIDLKRFPSIPWLKKTMKDVGFRDVHHHILRYDRGYISTNEYLERVRSRYVSTLTLLSKDEFRRGLRIFQNRVKRKYGDRIRQIDRFVFVVGRK
jgi:ubiquinone/menaquinone biosynthesis C-methylase UbiE